MLLAKATKGSLRSWSSAPTRWCGTSATCWPRAETVHPTRGEEPYGREASARNRELVSGKTVRLEKDGSETDRYGRLLRYVWLDDNTMVNAVLVADGYAQVATYPPDVKYADRFIDLQREALEDGTYVGSGPASERM